MLNSSRRLHSLFIAPVILPLLFLFGSNKPNNVAINAADASYTVHGTYSGSFPFNQPYFIVSWSQPSHGTLGVAAHFNGFSQESFTYQANYGYIGSDSFTYHACDSNNNCTDGTVNLDVVNNPPNAVDDNFIVHRRFDLGNGHAFLENDSDPDHDQFKVTSVSQASHGTFVYDFSHEAATYIPDLGYVGPDSITYQACDFLGLCANATVTFDVRNNPPNAVDDSYTFHRRLDIGGDRA